MLGIGEPTVRTPPPAHLRQGRHHPMGGCPAPVAQLGAVDPGPTAGCAWTLRILDEVVRGSATPRIERSGALGSFHSASSVQMTRRLRPSA
jgi:hypothetical protein